MEYHDATRNVECEKGEDNTFENVDDKRDETLGVLVPATVVEEIRRKFEEGNKDLNITEDELVDEEELDLG